jgi:formate hydrogenlyase subunit 3/multisubunit Na+/H+ antiporter MnhD subunit
MTADALVTVLQGHGVALAMGLALGGAALAMLMPGPRTTIAVVITALALALVSVTASAIGVMAHGPLAYNITEGLSLRLDPWSTVLGVVSVANALLAALIGASWLTQEAEPGPARYGLAAMLVLVAAGIGMTFGANLVWTIMWLQIAGLSAVVLVAVAGGFQAASLNGALRVLAGFGVAGALAWFGAALFFAGAGGLDPSAVAGSPAMSHAARAGLMVVAIGLALTGLIAPLDHWGPSVFGRGPLLGALVAVGVIGPSVFAALARTVSILSDLGAGLAVGLSLVVLGTGSAIIGGFQALSSLDLRRLAGYAFAAQVGCALLGLALATPGGAAAAAMKVAAAGLGGLLLAAAGSAESDMQRLDGLAQRAPLAALCATLGCLVFMSAPFTLGYAGTWLLVEAALERGWWLGAALTVAVSLAGVVFGGRILERVYFRAPHAEPIGRRDILHSAGLAVLAILVLAAGVAGGPITEIMEQAGHALVVWPVGPRP